MEVSSERPTVSPRASHLTTRPSFGMPLDPADPLSRGMLAVGGWLGRYHRHQVVHLERLGEVLARGRRVILVGNHVLDVVDPLLFVKAVYQRYGVVPRTIGHRAWFSTPGLRELSYRYRVIPSRDPATTAYALREDGLLMLFPGGVQEAGMRDLRSEPYRLKWEGRTGFLRLALAEDAEILFFAAVGSEQMYYQSSVALPETLLRPFAGGDTSRYRGLRLTFGLLGPHLVPGLFPFPAQITHVLSPPLDLGDRTRALEDETAFGDLHRRVTNECQAMLDRAVREHRAADTVVDRGVRAGHALLRRLGL